MPMFSKQDETEGVLFSYFYPPRKLNGKHQFLFQDIAQMCTHIAIELQPKQTQQCFSCIDTLLDLSNLAFA
jgi:hypothetical protein